MENSFFGNPKKFKLDIKGRVNIPAEFRRILNGDSIYTNYINRDLIRCYPTGIYERRREEMLEKEDDDKEKQIFFLAEKCEIDNKGRIQLRGPISKLEEVIVAPNGDVFDIWSPREFPYKYYITE